MTTTSSGQSLACLQVKPCPLMVVSKAPIIATNPKSKPLNNSQEVLFTLLNRRFQAYLASRASRPSRSTCGSGAKRRLDFRERRPEEEGEIVTSLSPTKYHGAQSLGHKEENVVEHSYTIKSSTPVKLSYRKSKPVQQSSPNSPSDNLLTKMGCTEFAEYVVNRAKVRLKKRPKRDVSKVISSQSPYASSKRSEHSCQRINVMRTPPKDYVMITKQSDTVHLPQTPNSPRLPQTLRTPNSPQTPGTPNSPQSNKTHCTSPRKQPNKMASLPDLAQSPSLNSQIQSKTIYLSDRHSLTPHDTGIPNVPPSSPSPMFPQQPNYIHSMCDLKSQRQLKNRLKDLYAQRLKRAEEADRESKQEEKRRQREEVARLKAKQRAEIYALNKIMRKHEETIFRQYISGRV